MGKLANALKEHRELLIKMKKARFRDEKHSVEIELNRNWNKLLEAFFSEDEDEEDAKAFEWIMKNPAE